MASGRPAWLEPVQPKSAKKAKLVPCGVRNSTGGEFLARVWG